MMGKLCDQYAWTYDAGILVVSLRSGVQCSYLIPKNIPEYALESMCEAIALELYLTC